MSKTLSTHVRLDEHGVAWIDDSNVKVIEVALDMIAHGLSPEEIHDQHRSLVLCHLETEHLHQVRVADLVDQPRLLDEALSRTDGGQRLAVDDLGCPQLADDRVHHGVDGAHAEDGALQHAFRAVLPESDLLLREATTSDTLRRLISIRPDVIIVDDTRALGEEAVRQLRQAASDLPVIALASHADPDRLAHLEAAGAAMTITKPTKGLDQFLALLDIATIKYSQNNDFLAVYVFRQERQRWGLS